MENQQADTAPSENFRQEDILTYEILANHEGLLIEEMETRSMLLHLKSKGVLSGAECDEIGKKPDRRERAQILIEKTKQQSINITDFYQILIQTHCDKAINYIRHSVDGSHPSYLNCSIRCARFNFRKLLRFFEDCKTKDILFKYMRLREMVQSSLLPKKAHLIKTGLKHGQRGCDCILEVIRQMDPKFLDLLFERLKQKERNETETVDINNVIQILEELKTFLLQEIEPTHVSHVLLEKGAFSVDDHDAVDNEKGRRSKAKVLYDIIMSDISRLKLRCFWSYLRNKSFIWTTIINTSRERHPPEQGVQAPGGVYHEIQVRQIGEETYVNEDIPAASGLEIILTIPVDGDESTIHQAVDTINREFFFRELIAEDYHMEVVNAKIGSVVMRLRSLTDKACCRLLANNGNKLTELIQHFLHFSGLRKHMIKGNIDVAVHFLGEEIEKSEHEDANVARMTVNKHWNLLLQEVEPIVISTSLFEMKMFDKEMKNSIMKISKRKERVKMILNLLSTVQRSDSFDVFIRILREMGNIDIAYRNKLSVHLHEEAEKVRLGLLSRFKDVIEETEYNVAKETLRRCCENKGSIASFSDFNITRQERVLKFLLYIMIDDSNVLALKKVFEKRNLKELFEMTKDESLFSKSAISTLKRPKDGILYRCQYKLERIDDNDEITRELKMKEDVWKELRENVTALKKPKNILLLGCLGTGKSSFINTIITALTGKYRFYADVGAGARHNTTRLHRITRDEYWNPVNEEDKTLNLPAFIDIIGLDAPLSSPHEEVLVNSSIINLVINGKLPENCDLLDVGKKLKEGKIMIERQEEKSLAVDIIIVVISAENPNIPQTLIDEIYNEANVKNKQIPMFAILTKMDKCTLFKNELEDKKIEICKSINLAADKLLLCTNYRPNQMPATETDISLLNFLAKMCSPCFEAVTLQKLEYEESNAGISSDSNTANLTNDRSLFFLSVLPIIVILIAFIFHFLLA